MKQTTEHNKTEINLQIQGTNGYRWGGVTEMERGLRSTNYYVYNKQVTRIYCPAQTTWSTFKINLNGV